MSKSNLNNAAHAMLADLESNQFGNVVVWSAGEIKAAKQLVANGFATMRRAGDSEWLVTLIRKAEPVKVEAVESVETAKEAEEVLPTAEAALTYREPVAAFVAPVPVVTRKRLAVLRVGPAFTADLEPAPFGVGDYVVPNGYEDADFGDAARVLSVRDLQADTDEGWAMSLEWGNGYREHGVMCRDFKLWAPTARRSARYDEPSLSAYERNQ